MLRLVFGEPLEQADATHVRWRGKKWLYFGGCDYLRLSYNARLRHAIRKGIASEGLNVAASRKTTGNHPLYERLEKAIARYFGAEGALLVSSGYLTNLVVAQALSGTIKTVFIDELAHQSLQDSLKFLSATAHHFNHRDLSDLRRKLPSSPDQTVAVMTDGLFAHDGSIAPLSQYGDIIGSQGWLWVDDSHSAGVLGRRGRGVVELESVQRNRLIQTITFSKAFGVYGGAVLCNRSLLQECVRKSPIVTGNTPLPLPMAKGIETSLKLANSSLRKKLAANIRSFQTFASLPQKRPASPIFSFTSANPAVFTKRLLSAKIFPTLIHYPGGPDAGFFRFAISAAHSHTQLRQLADIIRTSPISRLRGP